MLPRIYYLIISSFRACVVVDDRLYVLGGQEGDFMAKPGSPIFKCSRRPEVCNGFNCYYSCFICSNQGLLCYPGYQLSEPKFLCVCFIFLSPNWIGSVYEFVIRC